MPTLRLLGGRSVMSLPSTVMLPESGYSKPAIMRSVVVLPQPRGPEEGDELAPLGGEDEVLDRGEGAELLLDVGQLQEAHASLAHQWAPPISMRVRVSRPMKAMRDHRQPGEAEADERHGGRLVAPCIRSGRQVRAEGRSGQEAGDGELADHDGQRQEGAAQERHPEVGQDDPRR